MFSQKMIFLPTPPLLTMFYPQIFLGGFLLSEIGKIIEFLGTKYQKE